MVIHKIIDLLNRWGKHGGILKLHLWQPSECSRVLTYRLKWPVSLWQLPFIVYESQLCNHLRRRTDSKEETSRKAQRYAETAYQEHLYSVGNWSRVSVYHPMCRNVGLLRRKWVKSNIMSHVTHCYYRNINHSCFKCFVSLLVLVWSI